MTEDLSPDRPPDQRGAAGGADYGICRNCNQRPATVIWAGGGGVMAWVHGQYTYWCEQCMLKAQIQHAREAAERLSQLEARLAELEATP